MNAHLQPQSHLSGKKGRIGGGQVDKIYRSMNKIVGKSEAETHVLNNNDSIYIYHKH